MRKSCKILLNTLQEIQNTITKSIMDNLTLGLPIAPETTNLSNFLAELNGEIINFLIQNNVPYEKSTDDIISIILETETFKCHQSKLNTQSHSIQESVSVQPSISKQETIMEQSTDEINFNDFNPDITEMDNNSQNYVEDIDAHIIDIDEDSKTEDEIMFDDFDTLMNETESNSQDNTIETEETINFDDISSLTNENVLENTNTNLIEENDDSSDITLDFPGTNAATPVISSLQTGNIFIEEKKIHKSNLVFDTYKLGLSHRGFGRPDEMYFMVAPFEIKKTETATVPIIVYCYFNGKTYHASSYDTKEQGKNIVQITVGDYEFLIRGGFDKDGKFKTQIMTTGISANQGDKIAVYSHKEYSPENNISLNGHAKFKYIGENGETGIMDVFPVDIEEDDFIAVGRCADFVDYYNIGNPRRGGLSTNYIYGGNQTQTIIARWDDEFLDTDVVPV